MIKDLRGRGFILRAAKPFDGIKGFKDEVGAAKAFLQGIYDGKRLNGFIGRKIAMLFNKILEIFAAHCILLVMEKDPSGTN